MSLFHTIEQKEAPEILKLIVEIGEGDCNKYEYNHEKGVLELDRVLYAPMVYPVNYCDVPGTWNEGDGDPLDALVFSSAPIIPGSLVTGRVVGALEMIDNGEEDHKIICVNEKDPRYKHVKTVDDLAPYELKDVKHFFELYKIPQTGVGSVKVGKFLTVNKTHDLIKKSIKAYEKKFGRGR